MVNFQGRKFSRIGEKDDFRWENFRGLLAFVAPKDAVPQILQRKLSSIATKPQNSQKFSPSKIFCYTVRVSNLSVCRCVPPNLSLVTSWKTYSWSQDYQNPCTKLLTFPRVHTFSEIHKCIFARPLTTNWLLRPWQNYLLPWTLVRNRSSEYKTLFTHVEGSGHKYTFRLFILVLM